MILQTKRLILRPWNEDDAESLHKYASHPDVGPSAGWLAHTSVENSREIIHDVLSLPETYAVVLKNSNEPIGSAGIMSKNDANPEMGCNEAEIGYWIGVDHWGKGLIPEAVDELLRRCFEDLGYVAVWCGYYEGNAKSKRVQEKCGFKHRLTVNDAYCHPLKETRVEHFSCITKAQWDECAKS
jgi:RimJ/RimL family protein N-acetyltransferase